VETANFTVRNPLRSHSLFLPECETLRAPVGYRPLKPRAQALPVVENRSKGFDILFEAVHRDVTQSRYLFEGASRASQFFIRDVWKGGS
jgi:hypothetical protein